MKRFGTALIVAVSALAGNAHAVENDFQCAIESGANASAYIAFVVDWYDVDYSTVATIQQASTETILPLAEPGDAAPTLDMAEIDAVAPSVLASRPIPLQRPRTVQNAADLEVPPMRPVVAAQTPPARAEYVAPPGWQDGLRGVWFIGSFR